MDFSEKIRQTGLVFQPKRSGFAGLLFWVLAWVVLVFPAAPEARASGAAGKKVAVFDFDDGAKTRTS